jgi:hypothetical protein
MPCKECGSSDLQKLNSELTVTYPTVRDIKTPPVYICQELWICLSCGLAEIRIPTRELELLKKGKDSFAI